MFFTEMFYNINKTHNMGIAILALIFLEMLIFISPLRYLTLCFCPILLFNALLVLGTVKHNVDIILIWMNWAVLQTVIVTYYTFVPNNSKQFFFPNIFNVGLSDAFEGWV